MAGTAHTKWDQRFNWDWFCPDNKTSHTLSVSNDSGTELSIKDKKHFKRAFKIYEKIWADEPEMIKAKYQEIQELYPQIGFSWIWIQFLLISVSAKTLINKRQ